MLTIKNPLDNGAAWNRFRSGSISSSNVYFFIYFFIFISWIHSKTIFIYQPLICPTMPLVDVHAHLDDPQFQHDLPEVIERAIQAGVHAIITNGVNPETNRKVLDLSKKYPIIKAALGIYPIDALAQEVQLGEHHLTAPIPFDVDEEILFIKHQKDSIIAIGEIGLDNHWVKGKLDHQREVFHKLLDLAKKIKKPVLVHSRDAELETIEAIEASGVKLVDMHCFGGNKKLVNRVEDNGWWLSIPPNILRSSHFQSIVKSVDINQLFTETDSPYLAPDKNQRNEPAFVKLTVQKIAELKKMDVHEVEQVIFKNYRDVFG